MFIDTHLHLSYKYGETPSKYIMESNANNVKLLIVSACDKESMIESDRLLEEYPSLYYSFGFHPEFASSISNDDINHLVNSISNKREKIVAIGEIGLDYHYGNENIQEQKNLFERQLQISVDLSLPVVIHSRDATQDTYDILSKYNVFGVIHCFSGSLEMALKYIDLGFYIGIGGVVTFKNSKLQEVVKNIPLSKIVLETDSPYLAPSPYRGEVNSSKYIPIIASKIAELKELSIEEVMRVTTSNAIALFDLKI